MLLLLVGCGPASSPPVAPHPVEVGPDPCRIDPGGTMTDDTILVAFAGPENERLLSRQDRVPLVRLDCEGQLRPGLATTWSPDTSRKVWTLELDSTLEAGQAIAEWRGRAAADAVLQSAGVQTVQPLDAHRVSLTFWHPGDSLPRVLADPVLSLDHPQASPVLQPFPAAADPRDALDRGADLLESRDPALLEYAASNPNFLVTPLPWTRTYVLLITHGSTAFQTLVEGDSIAFRKSLARDAVQGDAREASPPFWWESFSNCRFMPAIEADTRPSPTVVYLRNDPVARSLAERVVALSSTAGASARGVDSTTLTQALAGSREAGFVLSLPRIALVPCREMVSWPFRPVTVVPLVETRSRLIVRRGVPPLQVDWDGTVRPAPTP